MLGASERWQVEVAGGGGHDLLTLAPIERCGGVGVAAVGLGNMLNCGGAVREFWLEETGGPGCQGVRQGGVHWLCGATIVLPSGGAATSWQDSAL